jgi:hypothetical protein
MKKPPARGGSPGTGSTHNRFVQFLNLPQVIGEASGHRGSDFFEGAMNPAEPKTGTFLKFCSSRKSGRF